MDDAKGPKIGSILGWNAHPTKFARRYHCFKVYSGSGASVSLCKKYALSPDAKFLDPLRNHKNTCAQCEREYERAHHA